MNRHGSRASCAVSLALLLLGPRASSQSASSAPAWIDYDGDGRTDLALLDEAGSLRLYRNEAQGFREATSETGLARLAGLRLARWADFDRDGRADLLGASASGALELLRSTGATFETLDAGLAAERVVSAEWTDVDGDGWSDLWIRGEDAWGLFRNGQGRSLEPVTSAAAAPAAFEVPATVPADLSSEYTRPRALDDAGAADPTGRRSAGSAFGGSLASRAPAGGAVPAASAGRPPPESEEATFTAPCARTLFDEATAGCLAASSAPTLGKLFPLSSAFNVDPGGRVGIGALGPTHRLTVTTPTSDALRLIGPGATYGFGARLNFGDGNYAYLSEDVDDSLEIHSAGRTALTGGFVGIGTTSPSWPLHVVGTQGVGRFDSTSSTNGSVVELRNFTAAPTHIGAVNFVNALGQYKGQVAYTGSDALSFTTNGAERVRINNSGSVGIGTTLPFWPLHIVGSRAYARLDSTNSTFGSALELHNFTVNPTDLGAVNFVDANAQLRGQVAYKGVADALVFSSGGAERLRIDGAGDVGIGTTNPTVPVDVVDAALPFGSVLRVTETSAAVGSAAIEASSDGTDTSAIRGINYDTAVSPYTGVGVEGRSYDFYGAGVYGIGYGNQAVGVAGEGTVYGPGILAVGDFVATGGKYFAQPHPSDPSKEIRFACLEGDESGTYFRERVRLRGGRAELPAPEAFRLVTEPDDLTVQLTTVGRAQVWVESYDLDRIVVAGDRDVEVHVLVQGVRRGFRELPTIRENRRFVPEERGVPFGTQYPDDLRRILVENGILNADFTPNEGTAAAMGWTLRDPSGEEDHAPRSLP